METKELHEDQLNLSTERKEEVPGDWAGGGIRALAVLRKLEFVTQIFLSQTLLSLGPWCGYCGTLPSRFLVLLCNEENLQGTH